MTEFEIISTIKNYVTSQRGVTGSSLRNEQVGNEVDTLRTRMIDDLDTQGKFRKPYQSFTQKIEFVVDNTKKKILPAIYIKQDGSPAISYIGGKLGNTPFRVIYGSTHGNWITKDEDLSLMPTVQVDGSELTFLNFESVDLMLIAVFEDPSDLEADYNYDDETSEYPLPGKMQDVLIGKTAESYMRQMFRIPPQPNNQIDNPQQPARK